METTKIRIDVNQNEAIKLGRKTYGQVDIDIDPAELTPEQRETLAAAYKVDGHPFPQRDYNFEPHVGEATLETAKYILDWYSDHNKKRAEKAKAEYETAVATALSLPIDKLWYKGSYGYNIRKSDISYSDSVSAAVLNDPRMAEKLAAVNARITELQKEDADKETAHKAWRKEIDEKAAAEKTAKDKAAAEKAARKKAQIVAWVEKNGTDNQKKRLSVNLLPDDEIIDMIRNEAFAALSDLQRYEKLTPSDVDCSCGEYDDKNVIFDVDESETATAEQFDFMEKIKSLIPDAKTTLKIHTAKCDRCVEDDDAEENGYIERFSVIVGLTVGDFYFTREYAA